VTRIVDRIRYQLSDVRPAKRAGLILLFLAVFSVAGTSAWAYWTTFGSGTASASTGTLNAPTNVTVPATSTGTVLVSWTGSTLSNSTPAQGYYVTRIKTSDSSTAPACASSASSLIAGPSCNDLTVPDGSLSYTVTAVYNSWTATSAPSGDVAVASTIATTTAVTSSSNPSVVGQSVLYTATVTPNSGSTTPTGTVSFKNGAANITCTGGNQTLNGSGVATCQLTYSSVGTQSITAVYAGAGSFTASTSTSLTQTVNQASQTITFSSSAPGTATFGGSTYTVAATASSGLTVTFTSATTPVCTVSGSSVSFVGVGTCTVNANQAGNANFNAAAQVQQSFTVAKASQTITFSSSAPGTATFGGSTYTVAASASSGLTVVFTSATTPVCTVSGSSVTFVGAGSCTINADQAGTTNYNPATQAQQTFTVAKANQTITFTSTVPTTATVGGSTYTAAATASSGLTVTFTSATTPVCTVSGSTVTFLAAGTCTVNADQTGNANYNAATQVQQSFTVSAATPVTITTVLRSSGNKKVLFNGSGAVATTTITVTICAVNSFPCASPIATSLVLNPAAGSWASAQSNNNLAASQTYFAQAVQGSTSSAIFTFSTSGL
jgi:hypothetical protein